MSKITLREKMETLIMEGKYSRFATSEYSQRVPAIKCSEVAVSRRHLYEEKKNSYPHMCEEKLVEYANSFILFVNKTDLMQLNN